MDDSHEVVPDDRPSTSRNTCQDNNTKMEVDVYKASANKNAILVSAFQTPQHFTHFGWTFAVEFFSRVYHPQDVRDEKPSPSTLGTWRNENPGSVVIPSIPWKFHGIDGITAEFRRNPDWMSLWQNSDENSVRNPSRFRRFRRSSVAILSRFPCSQCARAKLTFPSRMSWGW